MPITTPPLETVAACAASAHIVGPELRGILARYSCPTVPNNPEVARALQAAGTTIIPGSRLEDAAETAAWASYASREAFDRYDRQVYAENRIPRPVLREAPTLPQRNYPPDEYAQDVFFTTLDGERISEYLVGVYIGAGLGSPALSHQAVEILKAALNHGVTHTALWQLSRIAVWDGLSAAQEALHTLMTTPQGADSAARARATPTRTAGLEWSDEIVWDDDAPPTAIAPTTATDDDFDQTIAQFSMFSFAGDDRVHPVGVSL
jgi:hypothetical protein